MQHPGQPRQLASQPGSIRCTSITVPASAAKEAPLPCRSQAVTTSHSVQVAGVNIEAEERGTGADATRPARSMPPEPSCFSPQAIKDLVLPKVKLRRQQALLPAAAGRSALLAAPAPLSRLCSSA